MDLQGLREGWRMLFASQRSLLRGSVPWGSTSSPAHTAAAAAGVHPSSPRYSSQACL